MLHVIIRCRPWQIFTTCNPSPIDRPANGMLARNQPAAKIPECRMPEEKLGPHSDNNLITVLQASGACGLYIWAITVGCATPGSRQAAGNMCIIKCQSLDARRPSSGNLSQMLCGLHVYTDTLLPMTGDSDGGARTTVERQGPRAKIIKPCYA